MSITQTFKLNLIPDSQPIVINCDQYDKGTGRLIIKLYEDDLAYTPTGTAVIQGTKPDGKGFAYNATLSGNTVTADLTEQMTAVAGRVRCQVVVTESTGRTGTFVFMLDVQRSALPTNTDLSDSDYQIIEQAIEDSEAWAVGERGGVPVSADDPTYDNNSKYWAYIASQYAQGGIIFKGSVLFANIPTVGMSDGDMYNITDDFTTDARFEEGAGIECKAGTNIVWNSNSKWDLFATAAVGSLNDLTDVTLSSIVDGQLLKYVTGSSKWVNGWIDYSNANLSSAAEFVNGTADTAQSAHDFGKFFKIKDINNAFGLGANMWLRGFVVYQNIVSNPYSSITGGGILFRNDIGNPYWFYIGGDGSVGNPFAISTSAFTVSTLDSLSNVDITTPVNGQVLTYDGNSGEWKNANGGGGGSSTLAGLTDVTVTTPSDGQLLTYDSNSSQWINAAAGPISDLSDVTVTTPTDGQILTYDANSSKWINGNGGGGSSTLAGLTDVTLTSPQIGQTLQYNFGGDWVDGWTDYYSDSISTISDFVTGVQGKAALQPQDQHMMSMFFRIQDDGNIFGFGANSYLSGFVSFGVLYALPGVTDVSGKGIVYNQLDGTPYAFTITGAGTVSEPYALSKTPILTGTLDDKFKGLYGMTEITSQASDLNNYTDVGNYYKSATDFSLSHTPSSNATARCFLSVSKMFSTNDDVIIQHILIQPSTGAQAVREWYRTATKSGGTWTFVNWQRNATQSSLESTAGFWSSTVSCLVGDTTATFTDTTYSSSWTFDAYCDDGTGEPIAISKIEVNASDQAVVTFASALASATDVKLHYWK